MNTKKNYSKLAIVVASLLLFSTLPMAAMAAVPYISSTSPNSATVGSGSFVLTIYGGNFVPSSQVRFNGVLMTTAYISANQLTAVIPASAIATAVSDAVSVVNPNPGGGDSNMLLFAVNPISTTPGLPNTGFGPTDPTPAENNFGLAAAGLAIVVLLSVAIVAKKQLWSAKK